MQMKSTVVVDQLRDASSRLAASQNQRIAMQKITIEVRP